MDTRQNPHRRLENQSRQTYLISYNALSCLLWIAVLGRVLLLVPLVGFGEVYNGVGEWTKWTQTLMLVEVVHSATSMPSFPPQSFSTSWHVSKNMQAEDLQRQCFVMDRRLMSCIDRSRPRPPSHDSSPSPQPYPARLADPYATP